MTCRHDCRPQNKSLRAEEARVINPNLTSGIDVVLAGRTIISLSLVFTCCSKPRASHLYTAKTVFSYRWEPIYCAPMYLPSTPNTRFQHFHTGISHSTVLRVPFAYNRRCTTYMIISIRAMINGF